MLERRKLILRREILTELTSTELSAVAGGITGLTVCTCPPTFYTCVTCPCDSVATCTCPVIQLTDSICHVTNFICL